MKYHITTYIGDCCSMKNFADFNSTLDEFIKTKDGKLVIYTDDNSRLISFDRHMNPEELLKTMNYANEYLTNQTKNKIWEVIQILRNELISEYNDKIKILDEINGGELNESN